MGRARIAYEHRSGDGRYVDTSAAAGGRQRSDSTSIERSQEALPQFGSQRRRVCPPDDV